MHLGPCYSIPDHFVEELQKYDPNLRVRWGREERMGRVERKVAHASPIHPDIPIGLDEYEMRRDGYSLVLKFKPKESVYPLLLYHVADSDLVRFGGAEAVCDSLEAKSAYKKERRQWNRRDDFRVMAADLFRTMNTIKTAPEGAGHKAYPVPVVRG